MAVWWTKTSSPFSRLRNPKPLASLNHLTVPCSIWCCSFKYDLPRTQCGSLRVGGNRNRQELQIEFYDYIECNTDLANPSNRTSCTQPRASRFQRKFSRRDWSGDWFLVGPGPFI